jgi:uncharacterized protein YecE (DUF72 family)
MGQVYLGAQNWINKSWVGGFYPPGTSREDMLGIYSQAFPTVEIHQSFYEVPTDPEIRDWYSVVPDDFKFALRVPQQITHEMRLANTETAMVRFLNRIEKLKEKLGPVLFQLPRDFAGVEARAAFFSFVETLPDGFGWAVEVRDKLWLTEDVLLALKEKNIALVLSDNRWVKREMMIQAAADPTANWLYLRWNAQSGFPMSDLSRAQEEKSEILSQWASVLWPLADNVEYVFGYFSNQFEGHSPHSARVFQRMMGLAPVDPESFRVESGAQYADN